jgi:hypothetical protein
MRTSASGLVYSMQIGSSFRITADAGRDDELR